MTEAELLFTNILNCSRHSLYLDNDIILGGDSSSLISCVLKRRIKAEPIQYILGKTEFMGLDFRVTKDVLIPRPETEILVEKTIEIARSLGQGITSILDIGTGSGCIAVSLAEFLPGITITATDICHKAIETAQGNALSNNVADKIKFIYSDLFSSYELGVMSYDIIVSNPPYIAAAEIEELQPEVKYEPRRALDGGEDGLDFYRRIIEGAPGYLKEDGFLIMEMGFSQNESIKNIFQNSGYFEIIELEKDYNNIDRVIMAKKRDKNG